MARKKRELIYNIGVAVIFFSLGIVWPDDEAKPENQLCNKLNSTAHVVVINDTKMKVTILCR